MAVAVCCEEDRKEQNKLRRKGGLNGTMSEKVAELLEEIGKAPWGFTHLHGAALYEGVIITVLDAFTYTVLYTTSSEEQVGPPEEDLDEDGQVVPKREVYLLYDQVGQHFMACLLPSGLKNGK
jgi:hypothetical protein